MRYGQFAPSLLCCCVALLRCCSPLLSSPLLCCFASRGCSSRYHISAYSNSTRQSLYDLLGSSGVSLILELVYSICHGSIGWAVMQRARGRRRWRRLLFLLSLLALILLLSSYSPVTAADPNPYTVLGLSRTASDRDIKKAYRQLSKRYHPDKATEADAATKFHEVNSAYELLIDKDKRAQYDRYGRVDTQQQQHGRQQYSSSWSFMQQQYQQRYNEYQLGSDSVAQALPLVHKLTTDSYDTLVSSHTLAQSRTAELWLIYVYTSDCSACTAVQSHVARLTSQLRASGLGRAVKVGRVHADYESSLVRQLGVRSLPHLTSIVYRPDRRRQVQALPYHNLNYDDISRHIATQLVHTRPVDSLSTLAGTNRQRTVQLIKQRIQTREHATLPDLYIFSSATASPSLLVAYLIAYCSSAFRYHYVYLPALLTPSFTAADLAQELGVGVDELRAADNVFVRRGYHLPALRHVRSFDGQASVDDLVRSLRQWQWVAVPQLTADNYYSLCVNKRVPSTSLLHPSSTPKTKHCLVLLSQSQHASDTTAASLISQPTALDQPSHATQIVWLNPANQPQWIAAYTNHARQPASTLLIQPHAGQYRLAPLQLTADALVQWVGESGGWRSMWVPLLAGRPSGLVERLVEWWEEVSGTELFGWLGGAGGLAGWLLRSSGVWMVVLLGLSMFMFMVLLSRA